MAAPQLLLADDDYPLLNLFWTMLWLFLWVLWLFLLIRIISDIFRSHDLNGWVKALWIGFVIILPFLGVLMYVIVRGRHMQEHEMRDIQASDEAFRSYVQNVANTSTSTADELAKLAALQQQGVLTQQEFAAQKARMLT